MALGTPTGLASEALLQVEALRFRAWGFMGLRIRVFNGAKVFKQRVWDLGIYKPLEKGSEQGVEGIRG